MVESERESAEVRGSQLVYVSVMRKVVLGAHCRVLLSLCFVTFSLSLVLVSFSLSLSLRVSPK